HRSGSMLPSGRVAIIWNDPFSGNETGHSPSTVNGFVSVTSPLITKSPLGGVCFAKSVIFGGGGRSLSSPSGTPPSAQLVRISISSGVKAPSLRKSPKPLIAPQGGMRRASTSSLIASAQGRASLYVRSEKAIPPG